MRSGRFAVAVLALVLVTGLSGCDSSEERAERYFQSGLALLEAGDVDRALVEFRNVFRLNGRHLDARRTYADLMLERGDTAEAFAHYQRLVEEYPEDIEGRRALSELAIEAGVWDEAERHLAAAESLDPLTPRLRGVRAALDYRKARMDGEPDRVADAVASAREVLAEDAQSRVARRIVLDAAVGAARHTEALDLIGPLLADRPDNFELQQLRLQILYALGDDAATAAQLEEMAALFPGNQRLREALVAWHLDREDAQATIRMLRQMAEAEPEEPWPRLALVDLLRVVEGEDAAMVELDRLIDDPQTGPLFRMVRAEVTFGAGRARDAIDDLAAGIEAAAPSDTTREMRVLRARMLLAQDDPAGARAEIAEVLEQDANHVGAIKVQAAWLIEEDRPGEAISALRRALNDAPRDPAIMLIMAEAHLRDGSRELAGERLALAVEVSGRGAAESLRYAAFLAEGDRENTAERVLQEAQRAHPGSVPVTVALTELQIAAGASERAQQGISRLRQFGEDDARRAAGRLEATLLLRQNRTGESIALLEALIERGDAGLSAAGLVVRAHLAEGRVEEARDYLGRLIEQAPDEPALRFLEAGLATAAGEPGTAEVIYRDMLRAAPGAEAPVRALVTLLASQGREDEVGAVLDEALAARPSSAVLQWMQAGRLEAAGEHDGAIRIYEALYAADSGNLIVANNLASLFSTYRADQESLSHAYTIARRLRGNPMPAFQDTYGWIEHLRGNSGTALVHLEAAAAGLPENALVQARLGAVYAALGRADEARVAYGRAQALVGDMELPQIGVMRDVIAALATSGDTAGDTSGNGAGESPAVRAGQ